MRSFESGAFTVGACPAVRRAVRLCGAIVWLVALGAGCGGSAAGPGREARTLPPLGEVSIWGYRALLPSPGGGTVPRFDATRRPVLRVEGGLTGAWELAAADAHGRLLACPTERLERAGGVLLLVRELPDALAPGPGSLRLVSADLERRELGSWPVVWGDPPEEIPAVRQIAPLRREHGWTAAHEILDRALQESPDAWTAVQLQVEKARLCRGQGDSEGAVASYARGAETALGAGLATEASRCLRAIAFEHLRSFRLAAADTFLARAAELDEKIDNRIGLVRLSYYRGLRERGAGNYRRALRSFESAAAMAWSAGQDADWVYYAESLSLLHLELGRHRRARELLDEADGVCRRLPPGRCSRERLLNNRAWVLANGMAEGVFAADWALPRALFEEALRLVRERGDPPFEANALVNLAWLAFLSGETGSAGALLDEARRVDPENRGPARLFAALLHADILLSEGEPGAAQEAFAEVARFAGEELGGDAPEARWRARYGVGRALSATGRPKDALAAFRDALAIQEQVGRRTELREGRAPFFADRRVLTDDLLDLLLAEGEIDEAFAVAARAEARVLRAVEGRLRIDRLGGEARADWERRAAGYLRLRQRQEEVLRELVLAVGERRRALEAERDELGPRMARAFDEAYELLDREVPEVPSDDADAARVRAALRPGEALLLLSRAKEGWHGFWLTRGEVAHARVGEDVLLPWRARLEGLRHLVVVPSGHPAAWSLAERDTGGGKILLERVTLSYLPHPGFVLRRPVEAAGAPLVVADPRLDLPYAAEEGREVAKLLGLPAERLLLGDAATRQRLLAEADGARLLHFAGHGVLRAGDAWKAHLQLADDGTLELADVLLERPRIGVVVLNGCETGRLAALSRHEAVGLPAAFLAVGARSVLAADRKVDDESARRFIRRFYAGGGATNPGEAYRAAALAERREGNDTWRAFHLVGRP